MSKERSYFKIGEFVKLVTGEGPVMIVVAEKEGTNNDLTQCCWADLNHNVHIMHIHTLALKSAKDSD